MGMWYGVIDRSFSVTPLSLGRAPFIIQEAHPCAARGPARCRTSRQAKACFVSGTDGDVGWASGKLSPGDNGERDCRLSTALGGT